MNQAGEFETRSEALRSRAEAVIAKCSQRVETPTPEEVESLLHELEVYRVELEMQNEELRRNQHLLEESHNRYVDLYDFAPTGYVTLDDRSRIVAINLTAARMLETEREFLIGNPFVLYVAREDKSAFLAYRRECLRDSEPHRLEVTLRSSRGKQRIVQLDSLRFEEVGGSFCRMAIVDITARKKAEEEVRRLNATLEAQVAERTALAERRAQQLRALAVELSQAEQRERRRLAQTLHDNLQQLLYAARLSLGSARRRVTDAALQRTIEQVDALLLQSLAESRSLTMELSPPILYDVGFQAALGWLARQFQEKHALEVEIAADETAEPIDETIRVFLFEAVRELLFNVVKHAKISRARVEVIARQDGFVHVVVSDEGRGFSPPNEGQSEPDKGSLGLFSVRERLAVLGGSLDVVSTPGEGTRITLAVPRKSPSRTARRLARARSEVATTEPSLPVKSRPEGGHLRVLVVDDHQILREGLASMLTEEPDIGLVAEASNGQEAIDLAHRLRPHVILMDVTMPVLDGVEATRQIVAEQPEIRVIALSMHEEHDLAEDMRRAGAVAYLTKGGPFELLMETIRNRATVT